MLNKRERDMDTLAHIKNELLKARPHKKLTATFHSLVLAHADELQHIGPDCFCESVGMTNVWRIEFRKMIAAAQMLKDKGFHITKRP